MGKLVADIVGRWLDKPANLSSCLLAIGSSTHFRPDVAELDKLRKDLVLCFRNLGHDIADIDTGPIIGDDIDSPICGRLLRA